ncbi:MAG TPA: DUF2267 domain-containing protein [Chloroflexi bacterium]|jgi:uncharacterized protein (DUF2267 family)|nr:DUF2267 domain-containing protein [Chloroflexota bacterium]
MQYDEFMGQVQARGRMSSQGEAFQAVRAVLEVLGQRMAGGEPSNLAAQLPSELHDFLTSGGGEGERFGLDEFFRRVSEKEGVDLPVSIFHTRAVISVLRDAVTPGEYEDMRAQFPDDYDPLFDASYEGQMDTAR